jgi:hypothetical protein
MAGTPIYASINAHLATGGILYHIYIIIRVFKERWFRIIDVCVDSVSKGSLTMVVC